jgi:epoxyqueuosine reductase
MFKSELTNRIKSKAIELGFDLVGIAKAEKITSDRFLKEWLQSGFQASMKWMNDRLDERLDPKKFYPAARSVISVALNYYAPDKVSNDPEVAKISRYAWGDDYHTIVKEKLKRLLNEIKIICPEAEGVCCVDTSPVMDKYWAVQTGIGWQGKNSNVITRELGSWVFLGEVLLNIELEYDAPIGDFCGTCNRCIEACPTQAIPQSYVIDSSRCISYLTIEYRGESFPKETELDNWIYGCDICQDVCPWNKKFSHETKYKEFTPRVENINRNLHDWLDITEDEFKKRFKESPVKRAKFTGFLRNIKQAISCLMKK